MVWVDLLGEEILKSRGREGHVVNDAWSPSGYAHIGSLKGVVLHDAVTRGLRDRGVPVQFLYGFDDYDPLDGVPPYLDRERFAPYLGRPLADVPSPGEGAASFGEFFGRRFIDTFTRLGCRPEVYWGSDLYRSGRMNEAIRRVLDRAQEILEIDREISGSQRAERHPLQVICEQCGKIATTLVTGWDGREVTYACLPEKVTWTAGCDHRGRRSPFDGAAKLIYRVEWAAKWWRLGVTVEGAGKDHFTRGGSHDTASAVVERIFTYPTPFPIPYEFLLIAGKKMAGSAGRGVLAHEFLQVLRPELARFLLVRLHYREQKNFEPGGETIPRLYDEYDRGARAFLGEVDDPELARTFWYARLDGAPEVTRPRFSKVAYLLQIPSVDLERVVAEEQGAPLSPEDREEVRQRVEDARRWLTHYAPETYRFEVQAELPAAAGDLSPAQQEFLARLADAAGTAPDWRGEILHARIHELKAAQGLPAQEAFRAVYRAFLGKDSGPQAGWLLAALDRAFVLRRLREAASMRTVG